MPVLFFPILFQNYNHHFFLVSYAMSKPTFPPQISGAAHLSFPDTAGRLGALRQALRAVGGAGRFAMKAKGRIENVATVDLRRQKKQERMS